MVNYIGLCNSILKENGPLLGSELCQYMSIAGIKPNNARQILYRLRNSGKLHSTAPINFGNNQFIYFLPGHNLIKKIVDVIPDNRESLYRIYQTLLYQDGFLFWPEFVKVSSAPIESTPGHKEKSAAMVFDELRALGLVKSLSHFNQTPVVIAEPALVPNVDASEARMFKRKEDALITEQLSKDLLKWLERINIAGWNSTHYHKIEDDAPGLNRYFWDAHGFSYVWGLYTSEKTEDLLKPPKKKKGSLILIESIITRPIRLYDIASFISRLQTQYGPIRMNTNYRIIPICFMNSIDRDALELARTKGIILISIAEVFGTRIFEVLDTVRKQDPRNVDPDALAKVLAAADQSGQDGKVGAMKGYLFNLLVASVFNSFGWKPGIGVKYEYEGKKCECDVVAIEEQEDIMIVCECKGYNSDSVIPLGNDENEPDSVKRFFERTIPIVRNASRKEVFPVFITSATFSPEAEQYLQKLNESKRIKNLRETLDQFPHNIFYDNTTLINLLRKKKALSTHRQIIKEFYTTRKS